MVALRVFIHVLGESDLGLDSNARIEDEKAGRPQGSAQAARLAELGRAIDEGAEETVRRLLTTPAAGADRRWAQVPLRILLESMEPADRLLLVATRTGRRFDTAGGAAAIRRALELVPDLYGPRLDPRTDVDQILVGEVTLPAGRDRLQEWLSAHRLGPDGGPAEFVTGIGTGPTGLVVGCLMAVLADGRKVHVRPIQEPAEGSLDLQVANDPRPWLARRRMFAALATLAASEGDTAARDLLLMLDARQRLDRENFRRLAARVGVDPRGELDPARPRGLADAYFDRLVRREVQATMLGRAWLLSTYNSLRRPADPMIRGPGEVPGRRRGELLGEFIDRVERECPGPGRSRAVRFLLRNRWINWSAADGAHGLRPPSRADLDRAAEPARDADATDPRRAPQVTGLLASRPGGIPNPFRWSSAASGQVLVAYCVGKREVDEGGGRPFADALCAPDTLRALGALIDPRRSNGLDAVTADPADAAHPAGAAAAATAVAADAAGAGDGVGVGDVAATRTTARRGATRPALPRVRLIASEQTRELARESADYIRKRLVETAAQAGAPLPADDPGILAPVVVPLAIAEARRTIATALCSVDGVCDVEAVVLLAGPGANAMNAGLLLAGTDVATEIGCPVHVGAMVERPGGGTEIRLDASQVIALPGYPDVLARVALEHLADLELTAAADTLRRAGRRLEPLARAAEALQEAFIGPCPDSAQGRRGAEAARRIELVKVLLTKRLHDGGSSSGGDGGAGEGGGVDGTDGGEAAPVRTLIDQWHALHLAMAVADRVLPEGWYRAKGRPFCDLAYDVRSESVGTHGTQLRPFKEVLKDYRNPYRKPQQQAGDLRPHRRHRWFRRWRMETCGELLEQVQRELDPGTAPDAPERTALRAAYDDLVAGVRQWARTGFVAKPASTAFTPETAA